MRKGSAIAACVIIITGKYSLKCFGAIVTHNERLCVLTNRPRHSIDVNVHRNIWRNGYTGCDGASRTECPRAVVDR